jgi:hypothetical protein
MMREETPYLISNISYVYPNPDNPEPRKTNLSQKHEGHSQGTNQRPSVRAVCCEDSGALAIPFFLDLLPLMPYVGIYFSNVGSLLPNFQGTDVGAG